MKLCIVGSGLRVHNIKAGRTVDAEIRRDGKVCGIVGERIIMSFEISM